MVEAPAPAHAVGHQPTNSKGVRSVALSKDYHRMRGEGLGESAADYFAVRDDYYKKNRSEGPEPVSGGD